MARTDVMYIRQTRCNCRIRLSVGGWSVPSRPIPWPSAVQRPRPQHDRTSRPAAASLPPAGRAPLVSQSNNTRSSIDRMHDQKEASNVATRWCRKLSPQTFLPLGGGGAFPRATTTLMSKKPANAVFTTYFYVYRPLHSDSFRVD